ncbi:hypothetical protein ASC61_16680 [Aeromicrobium sp. Root344]|uniref:hypothetical protein n=1 Tax=Aeromicrobium sp. Root344 TaxID=1736521 RepID=UPI0006FC782B|nr:hypothetical protein [Aeromicrobium sp. Root344]KQV76506.1 hypothetical protein ASC61_16680 [Aeromicrobium sp. Root344]
MIQRPSEEQLNILRWVVTAALAIVYVFTGFEPALVVGVVVFSLPWIAKLRSSFRQGSRGPR